MVRVHYHPPTKGFLYILQSLKNKRYYIGSSINPQKRLLELHNLGRVKATHYSIPWTIVFLQEYPTITKARQIEYRLKSYKSKKIIEKIIDSGICTLSVG